ncbi:MAG TPA: hypothetical protein VGK00_04395 [Anaerolineales bacterium]
MSEKPARRMTRLRMTPKINFLLKDCQSMISARGISKAAKINSAGVSQGMPSKIPGSRAGITRKIKIPVTEANASSLLL